MRYVHFSARDIEDAILAIYGIGKVEDNGTLMKIVKCPRCGGHNPEHHRFCVASPLINDVQRLYGKSFDFVEYLDYIELKHTTVHFVKKRFTERGAYMYFVGDAVIIPECDGPDFDRYWFSRGGFSMQPNLYGFQIPYLLRGKNKHFLLRA